MSNQSGSAFWTCAQCGGMGSVLDATCPNCGARRGARATPTAPIPPVMPVVNNPATPTTPAIPVVNNPTAPASTPSVVQQLQTQAQSLTAPRQRVTAAILAFVGGVVGAQYFYMGRNAAGVACIVMSWTGYSFALGALEGIRLLTISDAQFASECVG